MKENILNKLLIACSLLIMVSCSAHKHLTASTSPTAVAKVNEEAKLGPIRTQQLGFNTFSGKAKASLAINVNNNDCTLNLRINSGKKIWVSVTALLGIEIARAIITPDSIQVINRLQGVYFKKPFSFIYKYANRQIDFNMLQALLIGNAIPQALNDSTKIASDSTNNTTLSGNLQDLVYKLVLGSDMKVSQTNLTNQGAGQSLQTVNAFALSGTQKLPSQINIASVAGDKKIQVNLHYVKVDINQPLEYPFNIPDSYTPAN